MKRELRYFVAQNTNADLPLKRCCRRSLHFTERSFHLRVYIAVAQQWPVPGLFIEDRARTNRRRYETPEAGLAAINLSDADWRLGTYQILEEIGRGGTGAIYRARQRHSRRIVALKRLLIYNADYPETLVRFRREVEAAAASLDHPNILPIHEVGESEGVPFFSMKFAVGGSVRNA